MTETEILELLRAIDDGEIEVIPPKEGSYAGEEEYLVKGKENIKLIVFNDCDSWDYLERVYFNDLLVWEFNASGSLPLNALENYRPIHYERWAPWFTE